MREILVKIFRFFQSRIRMKQYGKYCHSSKTGRNVVIYNKKNMYMYENTRINSGAIIMNTRAKFIVKRYSGSAIGLTVITGNHMSVCGKRFRDITDKIKDELDVFHECDKDVVVEEDVWIGAHVTLLSGVTIGRGSIVGSGSIVRCDTPPYSIVTGNPAKVIGFRFTPEEILEHEKSLYSMNERFDIEVLHKNYKKYFLEHISEIRKYTSIICK